MPEINAVTGALTVPVWALAAAAAVFLVLAMLAVAQHGAAAVMNAVLRAGVVIAVLAAGWIYLQFLERQEQLAARRDLDGRAASLLARAVAPGSALSCLDELAGEAVQAACGKAVFASPEAVSAAVSYVTAQLALVMEATDYARRIDPTYGAQLVPMRAALELDRFGFVAHVLETRGCRPERCDALELFSDPARVAGNLRDRVFDDLVTKYATAWNAPRPLASAAEAGPAPRAVSPQYDFPSADSIPAVNIMVPEQGAPNGNNGAGAAPAPRTQQAPPRRAQQQRPATPRTPTDGAAQ
jgi:hypothetical protein